MLLYIVFFVLVFVVAFTCTWVTRHCAIRWGLMDLPNQRSSHVKPVPRGGGIAIVIAVIFAWLSSVYYFPNFSRTLMFAWVVAGGFVALIGFLDDRGHVPIAVRMLCHVFFAVYGFVLVGGAPEASLLGMAFSVGVFSQILWIVFIIWCLNLFNFMDGIDGIAGVELTTTCIGFIILLWVKGFNTEMLPIAVLLMASLGFLVWNFPRAKIFMGDSGSGFVGLVLALSVIYLTHLAPEFLWSSLILLGVFIVDATFTLWRRALTGQKILQAHRTHAYQVAARRYDSHVKVTLGVAVINCIWLCPLAILAALNTIEGGLLLIIAYMPLIFLAYFFNAGKVEE